MFFHVYCLSEEEKFGGVGMRLFFTVGVETTWGSKSDNSDSAILLIAGLCATGVSEG